MGSVTPIEQILAKYEQERAKRIRLEGIAQYVDIAKSEKFNHYADDPWSPEDDINIPYPIQDEPHAKVMIVGTGFGALLYAVRLLESGLFSAEDMIFVDSAWGFGGTWYWNRYPGLMCDVESSCYMPLLEEMGYTPKHRYAYGSELREYAEMVARKWSLRDRAAFGSTISEIIWDENDSQWVTSITRNRRNGETQALKLRSDYVALTAGILNRPKLPRLDGLDKFAGHIFHTSRWDYNYTGGSPESLEKPILEKLKGKRVGLIGTGATAIQVVPQLAKWADQLYVFQRTPSAVNVRSQRPITPEHWESVANGKGWQRTRRENMAAFLSNGVEAPKKNLVDDGWTNFPSFSGLVGSPRVANLTSDNVEQYVSDLHALDMPRQEEIRARTAAIVKDAATAESLKPWYPGWCKRPCFHDEYLETFNKPNVTLVDTAGMGVDGLSSNGVIFEGKEYDVDLLILSTGFESFTVGSPAYRAGLKIIGRDSLNMDDKWSSGVATFHGLMTRGFPNLMLTGFAQSGSTVNVVHSMDVLATHAAHIISAATKQSEPSKRLVIEPTKSAEEDWSIQVASQAYGYAALPGCTPSYANAEGARKKALTAEGQFKIARGLAWGKGIIDFISTLQVWEAENDLSALEIRTL
ncbi:hypothetical protein VE03_04616 [Pseudogymnoascus sp. 23342-1-I1]|nr:hypothetical protein VE03_04616 [Pseudogymnoascus sp. 23342-1-I1]